MCFIQNDMLVGNKFEDLEVVDEQFVVCEQDLKFGQFRCYDVSSFSCMQMEELVFLDYFSDIILAFIVVEKAIEVCPFFYFASPLLQSCERGQDQERPNH